MFRAREAASRELFIIVKHVEREEGRGGEGTEKRGREREKILFKLFE